VRLPLRLLALPLAAAISMTVLAATSPDGHRTHADKYSAAFPTDPQAPTERLVDVPCVKGFADAFPCKNVDLLSFVPYGEIYSDDPLSAEGTIDSLKLSEIWGWANPDTGSEFVAVGVNTGVVFFNVTDPYDPVNVGYINAETPADLHWFDIKVYDGYAVITSESIPFGMLTFDMRQLEGVTEAQQWQPSGVYGANLTAHNVAVNEETGFAYLVGSGTITGATTSNLPTGPIAAEPCRSGLHAVDLSIPAAPIFAGCFALDGYTHDAQCVLYDGPDTDHTGREICFAYNEDEVVIVDMTDKILSFEIARFSYSDVAYTHQGWLTEDGRHLLFNDEGDEQDFGRNTRTLVADVSDLDNPVLVGEYNHKTTSIDHNNYVLDGLAYQSNYTTGLQILDLDGIATAELETVAFFDTFPSHDNPVFLGTWGNYPYLPSGNIVISGGAEGLFIVRLQPDVLAKYRSN
jgi:choice-of-anchor B domain-containing protein